MTARPVAVSICGDAGGAAALAPVLAMLEREQSVALINYAYSVAPPILAKAGVSFFPLASRIGIAEAEARLRMSGARLLLSATSVNELELEKPFIAAARRLGCRSIAVLDFWSNYHRRFSDTSGRLSFVPDVIAVMDDRAADGVRRAGIIADIHVTGHPAFDALTKHRAEFTNHTRGRLRSALGATEQDILVLFFSQPLDEIYRTPDGERLLGFDQHEVLRLLVDTLAGLAATLPVRLAIRPHPREGSIAVDDLATGIKVVIDGTPDPWDTAMAADLVTGMTSVALLHACHLGCPVLSLQPGLRGEDMLPPVTDGSRVSAYTRDAAVELLRELVTNTGARAALRQGALATVPSSFATERVRDCVYSQLKLAGGVN